MKSKFKIDFGEDWLRNGLIGSFIGAIWYFLYAVSKGEFLKYLSHLLIKIFGWFWQLLVAMQIFRMHDWIACLIFSFFCMLSLGFVCGILIPILFRTTAKAFRRLIS